MKRNGQITADISGYSALICIFFSKINREIKPFVLQHKSCEFNKMGDNFFLDFSFFTHRFFKENLLIFFHKCQMPFRYVELYERSKKKKKYFFYVDLFEHFSSMVIEK